ncbi:acyl-CoA-binding protein [Hymenobacter sp. NST-14]|uniref:acyl-CoA-binding protein n=1 Tax=Hymenobacter piscis TaxID=2839984 RepID=UPI001C015CC7|nr:acyl-CoA-binding protein [Hymenobacter piscis]MBT9393969.1 acyl-CoA-binding protein [Hymenobacter piscis]
MSLQQDFEAAAARVDNLPGELAAAHMTELYGLYKQATEGDHDAKGEQVGDDTPDNPNGPEGLSQGQWDAWSKLKGTSEDEAKRQYIAKANEVAGQVSSEATPAATTEPLGAPGTAQASSAAQARHEAGKSSAGGLQGDLNDGTPYGGEDELKNQQ